MLNALNFLWEWRFVILVLFVIVVMMFFKSGRETLKAEALKLMLLAKSMSKDGILNSGQEQEDWVVHALYLLLQKLKIPFISTYYTEERLRPVVQKIYGEAKDYLDNGKLDGSYPPK